MWVCFNDGFISAVADRNNAERVVVRSRRPEILKNLFGDAGVLRTPNADYRYRVFAKKQELTAWLETRVRTFPILGDNADDASASREHD